MIKWTDDLFARFVRYIKQRGGKVNYSYPDYEEGIYRLSVTPPDAVGERWLEEQRDMFVKQILHENIELEDDNSTS